MSQPNFLDFMNGKKQVDEAFNSNPYELTFGKKNAGDIFFTFVDEDEKEFRIQFYTPQGLGKNVRQVFIGQKKGSVYPDAISRFKNPMRVIASMIEATKQYLATPLGKTIDGFAVNFSKKALDRGMVLIPKIIRQSGLKQKLNVMDLTYAPVPDRGYVWLVRKGKDPAQVFDGPKMQGITWDDPDKVGDAPDQNDIPAITSGPSDDITPPPGLSTMQKKIYVVKAKADKVWEEIRKIDSNIERKDDTVFALTSKFGAIYISAVGNSVTTDTTIESDYQVFEGSKLADQKGNQKYQNFKSAAQGIVKQFHELYQKYSSAKQSTSGDSTVGATSIEQLKDSGFIARVLGIVDTNVDQKLSYLPGESVRKVGMGRYQTKGGLIINVRFDGLDGDSLKYSILSEIGNNSGLIKGEARRVANEIMETITYTAEKQYKGEWEINSVPTDAPYPITNTSRLYGWTTIETGSFALKISDAIANRVKPGSYLRLDLTNYPPRGKHSIEVAPEGNDKTLMIKDRSGKIYGSVDLNAEGADVIDTKQLKIPSNASIFGKTVHGFSVLWKNVWFPKGTKYVDSNVVTNVTFYHDKGKASITPMVIQKGKPVNNPRSYEIPLTKDSIQRMLDGWSSRYDLVSRELNHMGSSSYNPMGLFLDEIVVADNGEVRWGNTDLGVSSNSGKLLDAISKETDRLEKEGGSGKGGKTEEELEAYYKSVLDSAPKGRDLEWQIFLEKKGPRNAPVAKTLSIYWDITFRRNTHVGAFQEYKGQINAANQFLQTIYQDAKSKGYKVSDVNLVTIDSARRSDDIAEQNEGSAYSEYEQSLGGGLQVSI